MRKSTIQLLTLAGFVIAMGVPPTIPASDLHKTRVVDELPVEAVGPGWTEGSAVEIGGTIRAAKREIEQAARDRQIIG